MSKRKQIDIDSASVQKSRKAPKIGSDTARIVAVAPNTKSAKAQAKVVNGDEAVHATRSESSHTQHVVQVITGSYERILHGFRATIPHGLLEQQSHDGADVSTNDAEQITFSDTFLFAAHASSIRSLGISSPTDSSDTKRILATGSSDERINLYQLLATTSPFDADTRPSLPSLTAGISSIIENPRNRELGSLLHHSRAVTRLAFPTKGKLFSAAEDNTIAITRVRDWTMLSSIKAPVPKAAGRPSGDTAAPGEVPAGVNDFAVHPSNKLMISVGKGERCMRLWNLVTGKKAGVLNFDRAVLAQIDEGRYSTGEGRKVLWNEGGECFVVLFERGAILYGMDSEPIAVLKPPTQTKVHQARFVPGLNDVLALSTESGKVLFFDTSDRNTLITNGVNAKESRSEGLPVCACVAQLQESMAATTGRIKDFEILPVSTEQKDEVTPSLICITASSSGTVRLWSVDSTPFLSKPSTANGVDEKGAATPKDVGTLIGSRDTTNRLTCLAVFVMTPVDSATAETIAPSTQDAAEDESDDSSDDD